MTTQSTDYRSMFDRDYLGVWDLQGRDVTVRIARVVAGTLTAPGGRKSKKPVVYFEKTEKGLALNKTNAKTIAGMYGNDTSAWIGKRITLYPTMTDFGGQPVEAVRVRPTVPQAKSRGVASQPVDPDVRARQEAARDAAEAAEAAEAANGAAATEHEEEADHGA